MEFIDQTSEDTINPALDSSLKWITLKKVKVGSATFPHLLKLFSVKAGLVYVMLHLSHLDVHPSTAPLLPYYRLEKYGRELYSCLDLRAGFCLILLIFLHSIIHIHNIASIQGNTRPPIISVCSSRCPLSSSLF